MWAMSSEKKTLCGLWVSPEGEVHASVAGTKNKRHEVVLSKSFKPFAWTRKKLSKSKGVSHAEDLNGAGPFGVLAFFKDLDSFDDYWKNGGRKNGDAAVLPFEHQFLLEGESRIFDGIRFDQLRRCQCDIETACSVKNGFSNPMRAKDRVLAIGLRMDGEDTMLVLEEDTDEAEKTLMERFGEVLREMDPDVIEGHNFFKFDLNYLKIRCNKFKVAMEWGRFGQEAQFRQSRLKIAERWVDFPRCDLPGRTVFDTYLAIQLYDISTRDLPNYRLKDVAIHLGVTNPKKDERTYLAPEDIQKSFWDDRKTFLSYLSDDLRETEGIADILLPTYFAQTRDFPMLLQEIVYRGSSSKVDIVFLEKYFHERYALPEPQAVSSFEGGFTKSYKVGVFEKVLNFDVASLYPSLLLVIGRNPENDSLGVFIPLLKELREERLKYKELAKTAKTKAERQEYAARQASFKILINSFYGYLGFQGARFGDSQLASELTAKGRDLLQTLIEGFENYGCEVLEADTDGLYVHSKKYYEDPDKLLEKAKSLLPKGVDLEFGGSYEAMFCYKAKNYALYDGKKVTIRGSALRSRATEPFLKELSDCLIHYLLGAKKKSPVKLIDEMIQEIESGKMAIERLAKGEYLSQNPEAYEKQVEAGGKSRRASLEVALKSKKNYKMGDQVRYYITEKEKGKTADWQRAHEMDLYDSKKHPYSPDYYIKKIEAWRKRYGGFLEGGGVPGQADLFEM